MKLLLTLCALGLIGCATMPTRSRMVGSYSTAAPRGVGSENVYALSLRGDGSFEASYAMILNGVPVRDSSFHAGGYSPHEHLGGTWRLEGRKLVLQSGEKRYETWVRPTTGGSDIQWDDLVYTKTPNQSPQHNAGSRPSSGDSPVSETPSSLGPRG